MSERAARHTISDDRLIRTERNCRFVRERRSRSKGRSSLNTLKKAKSYHGFAIEETTDVLTSSHSSKGRFIKFFMVLESARILKRRQFVLFDFTSTLTRLGAILPAQNLCDGVKDVVEKEADAISHVHMSTFGHDRRAVARNR